MTFLLWLRPNSPGWKYKNEFRAHLSRDEEENGLYFADFNENLKLREIIVAALSEPALDCTISRVLFRV